MKGKKVLALVTGTVLAAAMITGCGNNGANTASSAESKTEDSVAASSQAEAESTVEESAEASTDPLKMITEGYYSYTYPIEGMDDMCAFFHFYEEQPVLGSVFYAGFAWNQITYAGTYTVEEKECSYSVTATREDQTAEPKKLTEGTAPYTVTFYSFDGEELGHCGFDGEILYNDSAVTGTGAEECMFYHDTDAASKYQGTYDGEKGITYLGFVGEDSTSTLSLYHNGRYEDMVDMIVEGTWTMEEGTDGGYKYILTPDMDSDTGAVVEVSADQSTCVYTPDGGESINMTNVKAAGPSVVMNLTGKAPIPGQKVEADVLGDLYDDGTVKLVVSAFGTDMDLDAGTYEMGSDGYTVSFHFDNAGDLTSALSEKGAVVQYVGNSEILGDLDIELVISLAQ
mgnify:CR=1 FL=1